MPRGERASEVFPTREPLHRIAPAELQAGVGRGTERIDALAALRHLTKAFNREAPGGPLVEEIDCPQAPVVRRRGAQAIDVAYVAFLTCPCTTEMDLAAWVIILPPVKKTLCPCPISSCSDLVWLHL